ALIHDVGGRAPAQLGGDGAGVLSGVSEGGEDDDEGGQGETTERATHSVPPGRHCSAPSSSDLREGRIPRRLPCTSRRRARSHGREESPACLRSVGWVIGTSGEIEKRPLAPKDIGGTRPDDAVGARPAGSA